MDKTSKPSASNASQQGNDLQKATQKVLEISAVFLHNLLWMAERSTPVSYSQLDEWQARK
jgi:hypothetical protein